MSFLGHGNILSVKAFAKVPAVLDLPEIRRETASVSNVSSRHESMRDSVSLEEGCILTKTVKYTHKLVHFVNAVHGGDPVPIVSQNFQILMLVLKLITGGTSRVGHEGHSVSKLHPQ
jgi:hypothetical protein